MTDRTTPRQPPDSVRAARALILEWLAVRDLSILEIRRRLRRRACPDDIADQAIAGLRQAGALDDERVARSRARVEAGSRGRGRERVRLRLRSLGIDDQTARRAVDAVFADVDEGALLQRALSRRLKTPAALIRTPSEYRRLYASLVRQGFAPADVRKALDARRASSWDSPVDDEL